VIKDGCDYKPLRKELGEEATDSLAELLDKFEEKSKVDIISLSEDKFERRLSEEISKLRVEEVSSELSGKISSTYANIIKWMFIFWLGQKGISCVYKGFYLIQPIIIRRYRKCLKNFF